ncbi:unnamed protein product [Lota lota]
MGPVLAAAAAPYGHSRVYKPPAWHSESLSDYDITPIGGQGFEGPARGRRGLGEARSSEPSSIVLAVAP